MNKQRETGSLFLSDTPASRLLVVGGRCDASSCVQAIPRCCPDISSVCFGQLRLCSMISTLLDSIIHGSCSFSRGLQVSQLLC